MVGFGDLNATFGPNDTPVSDVGLEDGHDQFFGGPGNDMIYAQDGPADTVNCGPGFDVACVEDVDKVLKDCEEKGFSGGNLARFLKLRYTKLC